MQLLAVNGVGHGSGVAAMSALGTLPILSDTTQTDAWARWEVTYRDVVVLDRNNRRAGVLNLTENDLGRPEARAALADLLRAASSE